MLFFGLELPDTIVNKRTEAFVDWRASETLFSHVYGSSRYIYIYIYIYVRLFLIRMCALSVLRIKFKS